MLSFSRSLVWRQFTAFDQLNESWIENWYWLAGISCLEQTYFSSDADFVTMFQLRKTMLVLDRARNSPSSFSRNFLIRIWSWNWNLDASIETIFGHFYSDNKWIEAAQGHISTSDCDFCWKMYSSVTSITFQFTCCRFAEPFSTYYVNPFINCQLYVSITGSSSSQRSRKKRQYFRNKKERKKYRGEDARKKIFRTTQARHGNWDWRPIYSYEKKMRIQWLISCKAAVTSAAWKLQFYASLFNYYWIVIYFAWQNNAGSLLCNVAMCSRHVMLIKAHLSSSDR